MNDQRLEAIYFQPRRPTLALVFFLIFYGGLFGSVVILGIREMVLERSLVGAAILATGYFAAALFILFYSILSPYRFKFTDLGVTVFTWRGPQFFPWNEIRSAALSSYKGNVDLVLKAGGLRYITIPINSFVRGATLLQWIRMKLPVQVAASEKQLTAITDE